ncbi:MAG: cyclodeaminase/cyclohydrolase family protein [Deltaproteobacteria bacterium]|jgi:formiminotetrahydrofolate cyclodeaminase|nr:cyclodeaminase/cyclohydrolase family protein [Deltaproteobacteria bacterium]
MSRKPPNDSCFDMPFGDFLAAASSRSHVPGGGSVAAAAGALGASMGAMVANLTLGKKGYEDCQDEAAGMARAFKDGVRAFHVLAAKDMDAFDALLKAWRLPRKTKKERSASEPALREALLGAILAPMGIARKASGMLALNLCLAGFGNARAVNDCGVAAVLLESSVRAAMLSVDVNIAALGKFELPDEVYDRDRILVDARELLRETMVTVEDRRS